MKCICLSRFPKTLLATVLSFALHSTPYASLVRGDIDYQYFRDFAENKGQFVPNATNISIFNKSGNYVGTMLPNIPMPNFSSVSRRGTTTLIDPQYLSGVKHNKKGADVEFGSPHEDAHNFFYRIIDRNDHPNFDYHIPRLHKLVTEVVPATMTDFGENADGSIDSSPYFDQQRFPVFLRVGTGRQKVLTPENEIVSIAGSYLYLTGGTTLKLTNQKDRLTYFKGSVFEDHYGPMASYAMPGDSGSPIFVFDHQQNRWLLMGAVSTYSGDNSNSNGYMIAMPLYAEQTKNDDQLYFENRIQNSHFLWSARGTSSHIEQINGSQQFALPIISDPNSKEELSKSKTLHLTGKPGTFILNDSINQGIGALYFYQNFTVKPKTNQTLLNAGVFIDKDKQVIWQVANPKGDRLSKIGEGTLYVNGAGKNLGDISVGEGKVILAQRADNQGQKQAFRNVGIVSGRGTVVLNDSQQVNEDNIYFGYRGGRLDVNGNRATFSRIQNVDDGAMIVNHNLTKTANVVVTGVKTPTQEDIVWGKWANRYDKEMVIYEYINTHRGNRYDYFMLKENGNPNEYFPLDKNSSSSWLFIGENREQAVEYILNFANNKKSKSPINTAFSGYFGETDIKKPNGKLDVTYNTPDDSVHLISGGMNLNGKFSVLGGTVILSGRHLPRARVYNDGQWSEIIDQDNWLNRSFNATSTYLGGNAKLYIGRNVTQANSLFTLENNARLQIGFIQNETPSCIRLDYENQMKCRKNATLNSSIFNNLPITQTSGKIQLQHDSQFTLGKAHFQGSISAKDRSVVHLKTHSQWTMTENSQLNDLNVDNGRITLNPQFEQATAQSDITQFGKLTVYGQLSGNGRFDFLTKIATNQADQLIVHGIAKGHYRLFVKHTGAEPKMSQPLDLVSLMHKDQTQKDIVIELNEGYVDLGAFRYKLRQANNRYHLYNNLKPENTASKPNLSTPPQLSLPTIKSESTVNLEHLMQKVKTATLEKQQAEKAVALEENKVHHYSNGKFSALWAKQFRRTAELNLAQAKKVLAEKTETLQKVQGELALAKTKQDEQHLISDDIEQIISDEIDIAQNEKTNTNMLTPHVPQNEGISQYANAAISDFSAQTNILLQLGHQLNKHLAYSVEPKDNVWLNYNNTKTKSSSNHYRPFEQTIHLTQIGGEIITKKENLWAGAIFSQALSANQFDQSNGKSRLLMLSAYVKGKMSNGVFLTLDSSTGQLKNRLNFDNDKISFQRHYFNIGLNITKPWEFDYFTLQPMAGVRYHYLSGEHYQLDQADIQIKTLSVANYSVGLKIGKKLHWNNIEIQPTLATYYIDKLGSRQLSNKVNVNGYGLTNKMGNYFNHEFALEGKFQQWDLLTSIAYLKGNEIGKQLSLGIKIRYQW